MVSYADVKEHPSKYLCNIARFRVAGELASFILTVGEGRTHHRANRKSDDHTHIHTFKQFIVAVNLEHMSLDCGKKLVLDEKCR